MAEDVGNEAPSQSPSTGNGEVSMRIFKRDHELMCSVKGELMQKHNMKITFAEAFHFLLLAWLAKPKTVTGIENVQNIET